MEYGKPFLLNIFTFNDLHGHLVENPIQTLIIRRHIVFLAWFTKRAWAACDYPYKSFFYRLSDNNNKNNGALRSQTIFGFFISVPDHFRLG